MTVPQTLYHLCDVEGIDVEDQTRFENYLKALKSIKKQKRVQYDLGYSNFSFELWMILHKKDCNECLTYKKEYLALIDKAYEQEFISLKSYKNKDNFRKCLDKIGLSDIKTAIVKSKNIMEMRKRTVENTTYTRELDYYSDGLREGDMITILYLPNNPSKITYSKFNTIPQTLFFVGGSICIIFSIACLVAIVINKFNCNKLKGNRLIAKMEEFDYRQNLRVFGKHPARLVCVDSLGNYYKTRFLYDRQKMIDVGSRVAVCVDKKIQRNILLI